MAYKFSKRKVMSVVKKSEGNMANVKRALGLAQWGSANDWVNKWVDTKKLFTKLKNAAIVKKALAKKKPPTSQARSNGNHPGGQPPKFKEEFTEQAQHLLAKGLTFVDLAKIFDVTAATIQNWKQAYPLFFKALEKGREIADSDVKRALHARACGYSHPDVHISNFQGKITKTAIIKHYAPDTGAITFYLKNRVPDEFKDKIDVDATVKGDLAAPITVNVVGGVKKDESDKQ